MLVNKDRGTNHIKTKKILTCREETLKQATQRVKCLGSSWWKNIKKELSLKLIYGGHPIEVIRARKSQPEITAEFFRLLTHTQGLCHIQRALASGLNVEGWCLHDGLVSRVVDGKMIEDHDVDPLSPILEVRDGKYWVIPLDKEIEFVHPSLRVNGDEKPILPDS